MDQSTSSMAITAFSDSCDIPTVAFDDRLAHQSAERGGTEFPGIFSLLPGTALRLIAHHSVWSLCQLFICENSLFSSAECKATERLATVAMYALEKASHPETARHTCLGVDFKTESEYNNNQNSNQSIMMAK